MLRFTAKDCATLAEMCQLLETVENASVRLGADGVLASSLVLSAVLNPFIHDLF